MHGSNDEWGRAHDTSHPHAREAWDAYNELNELPKILPAALASLLSDRALRVEDLEALGTRFQVVAGHPALGVLFPDALKMRRVSDPPRRWVVPAGVEWTRLKVVGTSGARVIVAEGETDAAQLVRRWGAEWDVAVLPSGALAYAPGMRAQLEPYEHVLVGTDADDAGEQGAAAILASLPRARRLRPPGGHKDWCSAAAAGLLDDPPDPLEWAEHRKRRVWTARDLEGADLDVPHDSNHFDDDVLPVGGFLLVHAELKSLKSVLLQELLRAAATGTSFAGQYANHFGPTGVLLYQMEVRPSAYRERVRALVHGMTDDEREAFYDNHHTVGVADGTLPNLRITDKNFESVIRADVDEARGSSERFVLGLDPVQRLTGAADINDAAEIDKLLGVIHRLQNDGVTVAACHHNNKASGHRARHAHAMTGSQRFGADADSICSLWTPDDVSDDDNLMVKERGWSWTLRNGAARGGRVRAEPWQGVNPHWMLLTYMDPSGNITSGPEFSGPEI